MHSLGLVGGLEVPGYVEESSDCVNVMASEDRCLSTTS
jgi:hypothetical protein